SSGSLMAPPKELNRVTTHAASLSGSWYDLVDVADDRLEFLNDDEPGEDVSTDLVSSSLSEIKSEAVVLAGEQPGTSLRIKPRFLWFRKASTQMKGAFACTFKKARSGGRSASAERDLGAYTEPVTDRKSPFNGFKNLCAFFQRLTVKRKSECI
ncbi:hypothetical protein HDU67_008939, partial [Dinochytrium kinnereticum]